MLFYYFVTAPPGYSTSSIPLRDQIPAGAVGGIGNYDSRSGIVTGADILTPGNQPTSQVVKLTGNMFPPPPPSPPSPPLPPFPPPTVIPSRKLLRGGSDSDFESA